MQVNGGCWVAELGGPFLPNLASGLTSNGLWIAAWFGGLDHCCLEPNLHSAAFGCYGN